MEFHNLDLNCFIANFFKYDNGRMKKNWSEDNTINDTREKQKVKSRHMFWSISHIYIHGQTGNGPSVGVYIFWTFCIICKTNATSPLIKILIINAV